MSSINVKSLSQLKTSCPSVFNVKFVELIGQYPCLWDYNTPAYNRKELTDNAWDEIAAKVSDTVSHCQMRWKSIRQAFARSMRPSYRATAVRKNYYLAAQLQFIVPFLRYSSKKKLSESNEKSTSADELLSSFIKTDDETFQEYFASSTVAKEEELNNPVEEENPIKEEKEEEEVFIDEMPVSVSQNQPKNTEYGFNKRQPDAACDKWMQTKKARFNEVDANMMFLQSLAPFVNEMTSKQNRRFRRKVMSLIDDVLEDEGLRN